MCSLDVLHGTNRLPESRTCSDLKKEVHSVCCMMYHRAEPNAVYLVVKFDGNGKNLVDDRHDDGSFRIQQRPGFTTNQTEASE